MDRDDAEIAARPPAHGVGRGVPQLVQDASGRVTNNWPDFAFRYRNRMRHRVDADLRLEHRAPASR